MCDVEGRSRRKSFASVNQVNIHIQIDDNFKASRSYLGIKAGRNYTLVLPLAVPEGVYAPQTGFGIISSASIVSST